jgi:serine/threonine protein kinase
MNDAEKKQPEVQAAIEPTQRRYIGQLKNRGDWKEAREALERSSYSVDDLLTRGAESVLYRGSCEGRIYCIKAVRNRLGKFIGPAITRRNDEKLEKVSYRTKVRHIKNEYAVSQKLYDDGPLPVVHIYTLRRVKRFGLEIGYDLIMEYLRGHDLNDKILTKNLSVEDKIKVFHQAILALGYMHRRKIIHLDVKPSNFMLYDGQVKLIDFGVSVLSGYRANAITGTGGYLSPEQICKEVLDEGTDIFSLGVAFSVFFGAKPLSQSQEELLTRKTRQEARYHLDHTEMSMVMDIPELKNHPRIADLIRECSIPKRTQRINSCNVLASMLRHQADEYGILLPKA